MATIKIDQSYIDDLKSAITSAAEQTSQAAQMVSKAVNGISGMDFSARPRLESELTDLKSRLNKQAQLSQAYCRAVQETVDALVQADGSAGALSEGAWGKVQPQVNAVLGSAAAGLSLAAKDQLSKQSGINGIVLNGESSTTITPVPDVDGRGVNHSTAQVANHSVPLISAWTGNLDTSIWPDGYTGGGCAVASTASALSGLLGTNITPKQIMGYQGDSVGMQWKNCESALGVTASTIDGTGQVSAIDAALERYLSNPSRFSAPIIGSSNPQHFVVVTGKNADGSYSIIDSSGYGANGCGAPTYTYSPSTPHLGGDAFTGNLTQVIQYQKNS